jgi:hypothetical protein
VAGVFAPAESTKKSSFYLYCFVCPIGPLLKDRKIDFGAKFGGEGREKNEGGEARGEGEMRLSL